jgi:Uma2 family endonuclease
MQEMAPARITGPAEHSEPAAPTLPGAEPALAELEFSGCCAQPMTVAEYDEYEGRIEFFDSRAGIAWLTREAAHFPHERPLNMLGPLLREIAMTRGSQIVCGGMAEIRRTFPDGETRRIQPDQMVYLDPTTLERTGSQYLSAREDPTPDVVVEVDSTTDVRRNRLKLYEAWGFPEVWVEVPDAYAPSRPAGLRSGLTIHLLEAGRYAPSPSSRAFPGWRAVGIHRALNEPVISEETSRVLARIGRVLGEREGTGPENDPLLREQRAEGRAEGRTEERAELARAMLAGRGIAVSPDFPSSTCRVALAAASAAAIVSAASAAASELEFLIRLAGDPSPAGD